MAEWDRLEDVEFKLDKEKAKNKKLLQNNLDLVNLYKKTAKKMKENGKEELADYFLAQIGEIPTMGTMDIDRKYDFIYKDDLKTEKERVKKYKADCQLFSVDMAVSDVVIQFIDYLLEDL